MKYYYLIFPFLCLFLCGFSLFKKTDEKVNFPSAFIQEPIVFSTEDPETFQKQLALISEKYPTQATEWWIMYKKALVFKKKDPDLFCHNMRFLSKIESFPLKSYARLNVYSHCNAKDIEMDLSDFPEWLKEKAVKEWHKKARQLKNESVIIEASYSMYTLSKEKYLREKYLISAIELAKKTKDSRLKEWRKLLYTLSPRYISKPSHEQKLKVANDLRQARQFNKATFYYRQILNSSQSSFQQKNESFKWIRWIYKMTKNQKKYLLATVQWKNWLKRKLKTEKKALRIYHNIFYMLARTQWTLNQNTKALQTLNQLEKELKGRFPLFKAYRMKALIFDEKKERDKALLFFQKALKEKSTDVEMREKTKWGYAWILNKAGKQMESIEMLDDIVRTSASKYLPSRALFWKGRIYEDTGDQKTAHLNYNKLIKNDPLSYYGLLAHYKLKRKISIEKKQNFSQDQNNKDYIVVQWLLSLNEYDFALDFLKYKAKQYQKDENKTMKEWSTLFYYMAKARSYFPLFQMVGKLPLEERTVFFRSYTDLMFPVIYTKEVEKSAQLFNMEKELIYALIRQESAWNPRARSTADAFGLMQIRPFVAKQVAKKHGISYKNMYDLYNPGKNILLGSAFLKKLLGKYDYQFVLTMAVYNAGRTAVLNWLKKTPLTDPLFFIEEIPYEETRTYVRLLIRNFIFYKLLTSSDRTIMFPEWLLHIKPLSQ